MKQENRHQAILYAVMRQGYVSIESLAEELGVSSQTLSLIHISEPTRH